MLSRRRESDFFRRLVPAGAAPFEVGGMPGGKSEVLESAAEVVTLGPSPALKRSGRQRGDSSNLDLLRSFAVLAVMIDHLVPTLIARGFIVPTWLALFTSHIGQSGVLAFFVHTSLVLMYSLERMSRHRQGHALIRRFYVRRAFRIYPLALACIALVLLFDVPAMTWRQTPPVTGPVIAANLLLVQNLWTRQSVLGPLWSLPYEVQMYAVLPALFVMARRPRGARVLAVTFVATCALGILADMVTNGHPNMAAYVACFVSGVLCYALKDRQRSVVSARLWAPFVLGGMTVYCLAHIGRPAPVYWIGWIFCLALGLTINLFEDSASTALNTLTRTLATYSYGLYLLHVPVLYLVFNVLNLRLVGIAVPLYFAVTFVLSVVAYRAIEGPFVALGRKLSD